VIVIQGSLFSSLTRKELVFRSTYCNYPPIKTYLVTGSIETLGHRTGDNRSQSGTRNLGNEHGFLKKTNVGKKKKKKKRERKTRKIFFILSFYINKDKTFAIGPFV
jgi:hypothetical protein